MKPDEAERKGASFHQQVLQTWEINHAEEGASVRAGGSPPSPLPAAWGGLRDEWLRLRPRRWVTVACQASAPPPGPLPSATGLSLRSPGQAREERFSEALPSFLRPSPMFPEARSSGEQRSGPGNRW